MNGEVRVPQPTVVLFGGGVALACGLDGHLHAEEFHGLFAGDTRVLSTYQLAIGGYAWSPLGRSPSGHATATWHFQNPTVRTPSGEVAEGSLLLTLRRRLDGVLHDDLAVRTFAQRPLHLRFSLQLDADFGDIFEVKDRSLPSRPSIRRVPGLSSLEFAYERSGFRRGLLVRFLPSDGRPVFVGSLAVFELRLEPGTEWRCCVEATPVLDGEPSHAASDPHGPEPRPVSPASRLTLESDTILALPFAQGRADLHALAVPQGTASCRSTGDGGQRPIPPYVAAGVPWFLTLFGRDSLVTALMAGVEGAWAAEGALAALRPLQATARDDWRDAEPGKLPHEIRRGELAQRGLIPHTPYYGTHDAPALFCLNLWNAWRWTGDRHLLDSYLGTAQAALRWCDEYGDRDEDGLQEYATRSRRGYRNQSWKDAGDAIVNADGSLAEPPLATVELQGYLFAARLAVAELLQEAGEGEAVEGQRAAAAALRARVEERFWLEDERFYAVALDRDKRQVRAIESNPSHLLWCGLPGQDRARAVAGRLLAPDLFSGWGLRTLSSENPAYDPLLYQRGSVWPHDTALAAAGLWRYGFREAASALIHAILEAAGVFEQARLPELFCGIDRDHGLPVPYAGANSPQAWAAAVPLLAAQLLLGLVPDAPRRRCYLSPWLPEWLPYLAVRGISVGEGRIDIVASRHQSSTVIEELHAEDVEVVEGAVEAPLWGLPPRTEPESN